jgi:uncharacterized repeat protein (TIGR04138 family)
MKEIDTLLEKIEKIIAGQGLYKFEAYSFVMAALHYTVSKCEKPRHVTGQELLDGIRKYALDQFGPMTRTVLNYWGIRETEDFGKIVFALVDAGILRKQPEDRIEDFRNIYKFEEVFDQAYKIEDGN